MVGGSVRGVLADELLFFWYCVDSRMIQENVDICGVA